MTAIERAALLCEVAADHGVTLLEAERLRPDLADDTATSYGLALGAVTFLPSDAQGADRFRAAARALRGEAP